LSILWGCKKEDNKAGIAPTIQFIADSGFVYKDTVFKIGAKFKIGIICKGGFHITLLISIIRYRSEKGKNHCRFRHEFSRWFQMGRHFQIKGTFKTEIWSFYVSLTGKVNSSDTIYVTIKLDSNSVYRKNHIYVPELILGAQSNFVYPEFYSLITLQTYNAIQGLPKPKPDRSGILFRPDYR
jgi:hypothetical protein